MKWTKNKKYTKELKIYNKKTRDLNYQLANKKTWFTYKGNSFLRNKNITPLQIYKSEKRYLLTLCIPLFSFFILLFIAIMTSVCILLPIVLQDTNDTNAFGIIVGMISLVFAPVFIYYIFGILKFFRAKFSWEATLKEHNIIKPKKWITKEK